MKKKSDILEKVTSKEIIEAIEVSEGGRAMFLNDAMTNALNVAIEATDRYGKESTVTVTFSVKKEEHHKVALSAKVNTKAAKGVPTPIKLYTNQKGEPFFENPFQSNFNFENDEISN